ncbi:hypothetical protein [Pseudooceanicola sp. MF1-13]|uniref:hypothetical protein n=1 Tax=Pseudooceanicola sp. MF1-13 TaxID=3379095 RepID=UPI003892425F
MSNELPPYYFRVRDNGAFVFKVLAADRARRIELEQIAVANTRNGDIKPHGDRELSSEELTVIQNWMADRVEVQAAREVDDILRAVDTLNQTTHWAQSKANEEDLDLVTDHLLLAMHDLRTVLVRKKAERVLKSRGPKS